MLVFLSAKDKIHSPSQIDSIVSTELPNVTTDPQCYDVVSRMMFHGPCEHLFPKCPCMVQGKCTKHFPKKINPETTVDEDGFPRYNVWRMVGQLREMVFNWIAVMLFHIIGTYYFSLMHISMLNSAIN
ncbi:hypothetical protein LINPERPRIM_LOCUS20319 [Linum perenne]